MLLGIAFLVFLVVGILAGGMAAAFGESLTATGAPDPGQMHGVAVLMAGIYLLSFVAYLYLFAYYKARLTNLVFGNASIDGHVLEASLSPTGLFKVYLGNLLGILVTLGLFIPWARVRTARYMAEHLSLLPDGDLDRFVAAQQEKVTALGEEMGEVFDIDIGL